MIHTRIFIIGDQVPIFTGQLDISPRKDEYIVLEGGTELKVFSIAYAVGALTQTANICCEKVK